MKKWKTVTKEINMIIKGKRKQRPDQSDGTPKKIENKNKTRDERSPEKKKLKEKEAIEEERPLNDKKRDDNKKESEKAKGGKAIDKLGSIQVIENPTLVSCRGANLNKVDMDSMGEKGYITDGVIQFTMESVCERVEKEMRKERIDVVGPNVAYLIQKNDKIEEIKNHKIGLGLDKLDWVFYPVSDKENPEEGDG